MSIPHASVLKPATSATTTATRRGARATAREPDEQPRRQPHRAAEQDEDRDPAPRAAEVAARPPDPPRDLGQERDQPLLARAVIGHGDRPADDPAVQLEPGLLPAAEDRVAAPAQLPHAHLRVDVGRQRARQRVARGARPQPGLRRRWRRLASGCGRAPPGACRPRAPRPRTGSRSRAVPRGTIAIWHSVCPRARRATGSLGKTEFVPERRGCFSVSPCTTCTPTNTIAASATRTATASTIRRPRRAPRGGGDDGELGSSVRSCSERVTGGLSLAAHDLDPALP